MGLALSVSPCTKRTGWKEILSNIPAISLLYSHRINGFACQRHRISQSLLSLKGRYESIQLTRDMLLNKLCSHQSQLFASACGGDSRWIGLLNTVSVIHEDGQRPLTCFVKPERSFKVIWQLLHVDFVDLRQIGLLDGTCHPGRWMPAVLRPMTCFARLCECLDARLRLLLQPANSFIDVQRN